MEKEFHIGNRKELYQSLEPGSLVMLFSGVAPRKTGDEDYPFFAHRNFVYLTGIQQEKSVFLGIAGEKETKEMLFMLPRDPLAERWNGNRLSHSESFEASGIGTIKSLEEFKSLLTKSLASNNIVNIYLDFDKIKADEPDTYAYQLARFIKEKYPFIRLKNIQPQLRKQRTIKKPCEIEALREAEKVTKAGIIAMMQASKPGMYEFQYKAEFDYALAQHGVLASGFPSIISSGKNNFCIHYYDYRGQAMEGDMILNDVGACWDNMINDVSRAWPCNGKFNEKQKMLYQCAYETSEYMFSILKPGIPMEYVDKTIREYNFERLKDIGLCKKYEDIEKFMWHGGAHHIGYDVHDLVDSTLPLAQGMVFCIDIGIYCEEWGVGFRLEDNCLITETGCENLSGIIPRKIEDIEAIMGKR